MRSVTALVLLLVLLLPAADALADYVVLSGVGEKDPYDEAARRLAAHKGGAPIVRFDPAKPAEVVPRLRELSATHVAIVVRPEQIHVNTVRRMLKAATTLDPDPFVDFEYGFITGATAEEAVAFVENIVKAAEGEVPRKVGRAAVGGWAKDESRAENGTYAVGRLSFPMREIRFTNFSEGHGGNEGFIRKELPTLAGCGALIMGGHGMPWEIVHGPKAEDLAGVTLFPAVAFNYACHTGVTLRYPERSYERGKDAYRMELKEIEAKKSFALAMLRSGVAGYVAYVNPRPAGPELTIDFQRCLTGSSLGEVRRNDWSKIVLGYLGFDEPGITVPDYPDGKTVPRSSVDAVRHLMLEGATGGILYGDPEFRPFPEAKKELPLSTEVKRDGDRLTIRMRMPYAMSGIWCQDPFRRAPSGDRKMAMKIYDRVELPADFPTVRTVRYESARGGRAKLETLPVVWAEETDRGKRFLHVKAGFDRGFQGGVLGYRGDIDVTLVADGADYLGYARQVGEWIAEHRKSIEGPEVYDGAAGVALFLFDLHRATSDDRWKELGRNLLDRARSVKADDAGLYTGLAGLGQVLLDAARATDDPKLVAEAKAVARRLPAPRATDIISGAAGTGIFLLNLHAETGEKEWLEKAVALGDYLEKLAVREEGRARWPVTAGSDRVYIGFSHGAAGIGYFLLHLGLAAEDEKYLTLAEEAAAFVKANGTTLGSGLAFTKMVPPRKKAYPVQWCHGSPGIALFFDAMHAALGGREYERLRDECVRADVIEGRAARVGGCQCHGVAGNAETFVTVYRTTGDARLLDVARRFADDLIADGKVKTSIGSHSYGPGYMTGLAGIGRFFLRLANPDEVALALMGRRARAGAEGGGPAAREGDEAERDRPQELAGGGAAGEGARGGRIPRVLPPDRGGEGPLEDARAAPGHLVSGRREDPPPARGRPGAAAPRSLVGAEGTRHDRHPRGAELPPQPDREGAGRGPLHVHGAGPGAPRGGAGGEARGEAAARIRGRLGRSRAAPRPLARGDGREGGRARPRPVRDRRAGGPRRRAPERDRAPRSARAEGGAEGGAGDPEVGSVRVARDRDPRQDRPAPGLTGCWTDRLLD